MKKKIFMGLTSAILCLNANSIFAAPKECIALTNYSSVAVEFDSVISPGESFIVQPKASATLSREHMEGACISSNGTCTVTVSAVDHSGASLISKLPRGTHIIYGGPNQYYLDKNAHVLCEW